MQEEALMDDAGRRRDPGQVVRDFKEFIKTHFTHDRRETDEPLVYRCVVGSMWGACWWHAGVHMRAWRWIGCVHACSVAERS